MLRQTRNILLLTCLVSSIYLLRDANTSPGNFLRQQISRQLENQKITNALCEGIDQENDITDTERAKADKHTDRFADYRDGNPLAEFIEGPEVGSKFPESYGGPAFMISIPFLVFFIISLSCCIYFSTTWICVNYEACRGFKFCKGPSPGGYRVPLYLASLILMSAVIITAIVGLAVSSEVRQGGRKIICSSAVFAEKLLEGSIPEDWVGIENAIKDLQIVMDDFYPTVAKLTAAPSLIATTTASGMTATLLTAEAAVGLMYTTNFYKTVSPRPDPAEKETSYKPIYIQRLESIRDDIKQEMRAKKTLLEKASAQGDLGINELRASSTILFLILEKAQEIIANISEAVNSAENNITTVGQDMHDSVDAVGTSFTAFFSGSMLTGILAVTSITLSFIGFTSLAKCIHVSWCTMSVLVVIGWALSAFLYPTSVVLFEACDVAERFLSNNTFFNLTLNKFVVHNVTDGTKTENGEIIKDLFNRCYYGDGDLLEQLNLTEILSIFENIFVPLDKIEWLSSSVQPVKDSIIIPQQIDLVTQYRYGLLPDGNETIQDLATLNKLTHTKSNPCTPVQDSWVLNSTTCPAGSGLVFLANNTAEYNDNKPTCIGFDAWGNKTISRRYSSKEFPTRCGEIKGMPCVGYVKKFIDNFVAAREDVDSIFGSLQSSFSTIASANKLYMKSVKLATSAFDPVRSATKNMRHALWDQDVGLIRNANCTFFRKATEDLVDAVCVRFGNGLVNASIVAIVLSSFGTLAALVVYLLGMKFFSRNRQGDSARLNEESWDD